MRTIQTFIILILLGFLGSSGHADESEVPFPSIPKAEGLCVAEPEFMRENHMVMLKHDRDQKVLEGLSDIDFSLKECIDCHVVRDNVGAPVSYDSPDHFCRSCHDYVAIKIDCFSCHNSKPDQKEAMTMANPHQNSALLNLPSGSWSTDWLKVEDGG